MENLAYRTQWMDNCKYLVMQRKVKLCHIRTVLITTMDELLKNDKHYYILYIKVYAFEILFVILSHKLNII